MTRTYGVTDFARLAGVTVRTLHHYDRIGLLCPAGATPNGHRRYGTADLIRMQQILTLKWMGFSLQQIKAVLDSPAYHLRESLAAQKEAVEAQIVHLQEVSAMLTRMLDSADEIGLAEMDAEAIGTLIRGISEKAFPESVQQYYDEAAWAGIQARRFAFNPADMQKAQQDWVDLYAAFEQHRDLPIESETVQRLAAKMHSLIEAFTGGDANVEAGMKQVITDIQTGKLTANDTIRDPFAGVDDDLREFMQQALISYRRRNNK